MLKEERLNKIIQLINQNGIIKIAEVTKELNVTEMTVRRDLHTLEEKGLITRVHGGATKKNSLNMRELSHAEKQKLHIPEKKYIAKIAASLIADDDIVYIGPGTTNELIYDYLAVSSAKIVTNSIQIFDKFAGDDRFELILVGGKYRHQTGAFIGSFTNENLEKMRVKKAFVGVNGIYENYVATSNEEEGTSQNIILNNATERYILCDSNKFNKADFYRFYLLENITAIITDGKIDAEKKKSYEQLTTIIH